MTSFTDGIDSAWAQLASAGVGGRPGAFDPTSLDAIPGPAARWLRRVLPPGAPLVDTVVISMRGRIRLGARWWPFTADQILRAGVGFVWRPVVGGRLLRFRGADLLTPDRASMAFRLHGLIPVVTATGPDVARSAAGRLAAETVAWLPQAVTPQAGAVWRPIDDGHATVTLDSAGRPVEVELSIDAEGRLRALNLERWNGGATPPGPQLFGGSVDGELVTGDGIRVAGVGRVGWGHGTPSWPDGEFFHYELDRVEPLGQG